MLRNAIKILALMTLVLSLSVAFLNLYFIPSRHEEDRAAIAAAIDIQAKAQQLAKYSAEAADGSPDALDNLQRAWSAIGRQIGDLRNCNPKGIPPIAANHNIEPALVAVENAWRPTSDNVQKILGTYEILLEVAENSTAFASRMLPMQTRSDELARLLAERGADASQVYIASRQVTIGERLLRRLAEIRNAGEHAPITTDGFARDAQVFGATLNGLLNGDAERDIARVALPDAHDQLQQISASHAELKELMDQILQRSTEVFEARQAANEVPANTEILHREAEALALRYSEQSSQRIFPSISVATRACAIALLAAGLLFILRLK